jgi:hypothetical protein
MTKKADKIVSIVKEVDAEIVEVVSKVDSTKAHAIELIKSSYRTIFIVVVVIGILVWLI